MEFIRRFLQHVLPTGFMKIRHYGFFGVNAKISIQRIRELICDLYETLAELLEPPACDESPPKLCSCCGHAMTHKAFITPGWTPTG